MRERNVGSVVLVEGARPVGFITDRDLALSVVADGRATPSPRASHASSPVITAEPDMDVEEAAEDGPPRGAAARGRGRRRSRGSSRSTTSPRAAAIAPRSCRRGSRGQRCPTTPPRARRLTTPPRTPGSPGARGCRRRPVRAGRACRGRTGGRGVPARAAHPSSSWAPKIHPGAFEPVDVAGRDAVGAVVALEAALDAGDPRHQRVRR